MGKETLSLGAIVLALVVNTAIAAEYILDITKEHRVLVRLKGGAHHVACYSKTSKPQTFEDCTIFKENLPMVCTFTVHAGEAVADCKRTDL